MVSDLWGERLLVLQAQARLKAGVPFDGRMFGLPKEAKAAVPNRLHELEQRLEQIGLRLPEREAMSAGRFLGALALLDDPAVAAALPQVETWRREVPRLLLVADVLARQFPTFQRLVEGQSVLTSLVPYGHLFATQPDLSALVQQVLSGLEEALTELIDGVGEEIYPFTHSLGELSLRQHFVSQSLEGLDPFALFELAKTAVHRGYDLYLRVLGRLAMIAEAVEDHLIDTQDTL